MENETTQFGRYKIIRSLGSGATSEDFLAFDQILQREVALKVLKPMLVADTESFNRFILEAQAAAKLFHNNIATILDVGEIGGRYYIAMRYINGHSLDEAIKQRGKLPWETARKLASQIGGAIEFAHQQGFLHRDIKPKNILVDQNGDFILTDFGLTRAMTDSGLTSSAASIMGTPAYIPPEIWDDKRASKASDQYSYACVLGEALTGKVLFEGSSNSAIFSKHITGMPDFNLQGLGLPYNVDLIIRKALEKDPQDRFASIAEFTQQFLNPGSFIGSLPSNPAKLIQQAKTTPLAPENIQQPIKHNAAKILNPLIIVFFLGAVGFFFLQIRKALSPIETQNTPIATHEPSGLVENQKATQQVAALILQTTTSDSEPEIETTQETELNSAITTSPQIPAQISITMPAPTATILAENESTLLEDKPYIESGSGVSVGYRSGDTKLEVTVIRGDGATMDVDFTAYEQSETVTGAPVKGNYVKGNTYNSVSPAVLFLEPGVYEITTNELKGYYWGTASDVPGQAFVEVKPGQATELVVRLGRLIIGVVRTDGSVVENQYFKIYTQTENVTGNFVADWRVLSASTDNTGQIYVNLTPGNYLVCTDFIGYNWGDATDCEGEVNIPIKPGEVTKFTIRLAGLTIIAVDSSGRVREGATVRIYAQSESVLGEPVLGDHITTCTVDNTGACIFNLTAGVYAFTIGDETYYDMPLFPGQMTITDGTEITQK